MLIDIVYFWGMAIRFNVSIQKLGHEMVATYNYLIIHKQDDSKIENQDIPERRVSNLPSYTWTKT